MAKREQWWVAKMDMTLAGQKVHKGQLIRPTGNVNDHRLFGDNTRWTYRYDGGEPEVCGSDGCAASFINLGALDRHRSLMHKAERDEREQVRLERINAAKEAEETGETIGGLEVVAERSGPGGPVPYIKHPLKR